MPLTHANIANAETRTDLMDFDTLITPLTRAEFMQRYRAGVCFVVRGMPDKFRALITLADIETAMNQGCNLNAPLNIVLENGTRRPFVDSKVSWSSIALQKGEIRSRLESGHSFLMMNMSQINPRVAELIDQIEDAFAEDDLHADLHLYVSSTRDASGYNAHRDFPQHKIYLQVIGTTKWQVFDHKEDIPPELRAVPAEGEKKYLQLNSEFILNPGDLFYMPPAVFHKIRNVGGPRVSFSIPCSPAGGQKRMDRTHIPFRDIFEAEVRAARKEQGPKAGKA